MSRFIVHEDQENRDPTNLKSRGLPPKHGLNILQSQKQNVNILQNKRTVLSTLTDNSANVRVQPRRAAKQGVSYEHGLPQGHEKSGSSGSNSSLCSVPSFTIHEDSSACSKTVSTVNSSVPSLKSTLNESKSSSGLTNVHNIFSDQIYTGKSIVQPAVTKSCALKNSGHSTVNQVFGQSFSSNVFAPDLSKTFATKPFAPLTTTQAVVPKLSTKVCSTLPPVNPIFSTHVPCALPPVNPIFSTQNSTGPLTSSTPIFGTQTCNVLAPSTQAFTTQTVPSVLKIDVTQSPVKDKNQKAEVKDAKRSRERDGVPQGDMDVSMSDPSSHMAVDTPAGSLPKLHREDILVQKEQEFWDVPEYAADIYNYLREAEACHKPRANYMFKQTDITSSMRWILVDWLVEVAEEYTLHTETLYLAVSYIDRFLSHMSVKRDKLQLVGTTAMFIASKYEEIYPPDVSQFAYITDNTYRVSQILRMEHLILKVLSFDMAVPTAYLFVSYFATVSKASEITTHLASFISELSMLDCDPFLRFLPSKIAAASLALANFTQGTEAWPELLVSKSGYTLEDLKECYVNLHRSFCRVQEPSQHAIRDKYKLAKLCAVSNMSPRDKFPW